MNQILATTSSQRKEKKNKEKNRKNNNSNYDANLVRRAAIIFSILLIMFAIVIIGVKLVQIIKDNAQNSKTANLNRPEITIERINEDKVNVKINYDENITKLTYWWNNDRSQIEEKNYNVKEIDIPIPEGETNTLHVEVTGADGSTNELTETLIRDMTITIEMNQLTDNMEIIARSENGIEKLVYYWNDEQATEVPATGENQEELRTTIELKRGTNTLHTIVTDNNGNTEEKEEILHCVKEPEITVEANEDQMIMVITVSHDMGFKSIEFEINGREIIYDETYSGYDANQTKLTFTSSLQPGVDNTVTVVAYSNEKIDDTETTSATCSKRIRLGDTTTEEE